VVSAPAAARLSVRTWRTWNTGQSSGKIVVSLEYDHGIGNDDGYWVMTFTDGTEITFRFMAELTD
jgi:hypothetical protein